MTTRTLRAALAASLVASTAFASAAYADSMTMWVRASGTNAAAHLVDLWNSTHPDKIDLTTIPDNEMVTKLATGVQAGEAPDLVSFDLIYMPDFMKAGFLVDLTADLKANPELRLGRPSLSRTSRPTRASSTAQASRRTCRSWSGTRTCSSKAGLDPDKPPRSVSIIHEYAKKIRTLGPTPMASTSRRLAPAATSSRRRR